MAIYNQKIRLSLIKKTIQHSKDSNLTTVFYILKQNAWRQKVYYSKCPKICNLQRVFITPEDRSQANDISRKTNKEIGGYIEEYYRLVSFQSQFYTTEMHEL